MYCQDDPNQMTFEDFYLSFGGRLRSDNRWVLLSKQIPWDQVEQDYAALFADSDTGRKAKPARLALGALIIKERLGTTDRETVRQIQENPYLQYFLGFSEDEDEVPFDPSLMTHFRKRFDKEALAKINESIVLAAQQASQAETFEQDEPPKDPPPSHRGKLIVDATCTPADISYPTDVKLLNEAREKTEEMIDMMHKPLIGDRPKPRTYRQKTRRDYMAIVKQKRPGAKISVSLVDGFSFVDTLRWDPFNESGDLMAQILLSVFVLCRRLGMTFTAEVLSFRSGLQHPQPHRVVDVQRC